MIQFGTAPQRLMLLITISFFLLHPRYRACIICDRVETDKCLKVTYDTDIASVIGHVPMTFIHKNDNFDLKNVSLCVTARSGYCSRAAQPRALQKAKASSRRWTSNEMTCENIYCISIPIVGYSVFDFLWVVRPIKVGASHDVNHHHLDSKNLSQSVVTRLRLVTVLEIHTRSRKRSWNPLHCYLPSSWCCLWQMLFNQLNQRTPENSREGPSKWPY